MKAAGFANYARTAEGAAHFLAVIFTRITFAFLCVALTVTVQARADDLISIRGAEVAAEPEIGRAHV